MPKVTSLHKIRFIGSGRAAIWLGGAFWEMVLINFNPATITIIPDLSPVGY